MFTFHFEDPANGHTFDFECHGERDRRYAANLMAAGMKVRGVTLSPEWIMAHSEEDTRELIDQGLL